MVNFSSRIIYRRRFVNIKKLFVSILFTISCMFAFSACSNGTEFNFDKNSIVKLTYTCTDTEKNFDAELTAGQSRNFILSLNKISYSEVTDKDIDFGPSYDSLRIVIGDDNLNLPDLSLIINNGGYIYFNGKLCKSEEKFGFLETYIVEYSPDIIMKGVSFEVRYVKQTVGAEENYHIIKSVSQLNDYIAAETQNIGLPDCVMFKDEMVNKYNDKYFENYFIVIFMKAASSGSFDFKVNDVYANSDRMIIGYEIIRPTGDAAVTCDMAYWYSFVELSNEYRTIKNVDLISLK